MALDHSLPDMFVLLEVFFPAGLHRLLDGWNSESDTPLTKLGNRGRVLLFYLGGRLVGFFRGVRVGGGCNKLRFWSHLVWDSIDISMWWAVQHGIKYPNLSFNHSSATKTWASLPFESPLKNALTCSQNYCKGQMTKWVWKSNNDDARCYYIY